MKFREILRCENCPNLGNHVHYDGKTEAIEDNQNGLELFEIEGIGLLNNKGRD